jgi:hypothetical protein
MSREKVFEGASAFVAGLSASGAEGETIPLADSKFTAYFIYQVS